MIEDLPDPCVDDGRLDNGTLVTYDTEFVVLSGNELYCYVAGFYEAVKVAHSLPHGRLLMRQSIRYDYPPVEVALPSPTGEDGVVTEVVRPFEPDMGLDHHF